jgi:tetratricopeptide (TPR) repeat protein
MPSDQRLLTAVEGYLELELPDRAFDLLDRADPLLRATFEWTFLFGEAHRGKGDFKAALCILEQARALRPQNSAVYLSIGWCLKRTGQLRKAIATLHEAEQMCRQIGDEDGRALVMYNLSCYYALAEKKTEMLAWLEKALRQRPELRELIADELDFARFHQDADLQELMRPPPKRGQ